MDPKDQLILWIPFPLGMRKIRILYSKSDQSCDHLDSIRNEDVDLELYG